MTNAEAIEWLKYNRDELLRYADTIDVLGDVYESDLNPTIEALSVAISALEKQEGKKPVCVRLADGRLGDNGIKTGKCPSCYEEVDGNLYGEYCGCCGQKLDWSEAYGADDMEEG